MVLKKLKKVTAIFLATFLILSSVMPSYVDAVYAYEIEGVPTEEINETGEMVAEESDPLSEETSMEIPEVLPDEETLEDGSENDSSIEENEVISEETEGEEDVLGELPSENEKTDEVNEELQPEKSSSNEEGEEVEEGIEEDPATEEEKGEDESSEDNGIEEPKGEEEVLPSNEEVIEEVAVEEPVAPEEKEEVVEEPEAPEEKEEDASVFSYVPLYMVYDEISNSILRYPLSRAGHLSSDFGYRPISETNGIGDEDHTGIDLAIGKGTPVLSAEDGIIVVAEWRKGYGNCVFIKHENGLETRYAHLSEVNVKAGESVVRGQQIGRVGSTGRSTGPHLHFEVLVDGDFVDPIPYLTETNLPELDFTSKRLLVKGSKEELSEEPIIANLDGIFLIQYETIDEVKDAYLRLIKSFDSVEVDSVISIAEGEEEGTPTEYMTENDNPFSEVENTSVARESFDVAVIDTGATSADKILSVIGDEGIDVNGHGQMMIDIIKELSPESKVLSIKAIGNDGSGDISSVYAAIKLAIESEVKVINLSISSLKTEDSFVIEEVIREALSKGITVVGAAGNRGMDVKNTIFGNIDEMIVVGANNSSSNFGDAIDYIVNAPNTSSAAAAVTGLYLNGSLGDYDKEITLSMFEEESMENLPFILVRYEDGTEQRLSAEEFLDATGLWDAILEIPFADEVGGFSVQAGRFTKRILSGVPSVANAIETGAHIEAPFWAKTTDSVYVYNPNLPGHGSSQQMIIADNVEYFDVTDGSDPAFCLYFFATSYPHHNVSSADLSDYSAFSEEDSKKYALVYHYLQNKTAYGSSYGIGLSMVYSWTKLGVSLLQNTSVGNSFADYATGYQNIRLGNLTHSDILSIFAQAEAYAASNPDGLDGETIIYWDSTSAANHQQPMVRARTWEANGSVALKKSSSNPSITNGNSCYSLKDATYEIYDNASLSGSPVATLVVEDEEGNTNVASVKAGTYYYKETVAGKGYKLKTYDPSTDYVVVTTANTETNPAVINTTDDPLDDPDKILIYKASDVNGNPRITHASAVFKVQFFPNDSWTDGDNTRTWYYKTIDGRVFLGIDSYLDSSYTNSEPYENSGVTGVFPLGTVRVTEQDAPDGYLESDFVLEGKISLNESGKAEFKWTSTEVTNKLKYEDDGTPTILDPSIFSGVKFGKIDANLSAAAPQGDASLKDAEITIYNNSGRVIYLKDGTEVADGAAIPSNKGGVLKTDINGIAESEIILPCGTYYAVETKAPTGYQINSTWRKDFSITETSPGDNNVLDLTENASLLKEDVIRGGVKIEKWDRELNKKAAQGDADFSGIKFEITNKSGKSVVVGGTEYAVNKVVYTMTTNASGDATTPNNLLPYGTYEIKEVAVNGKYLLTDGTARTFRIRENGVIVSAATNGDNLVFKDNVVRGGVKIEKWDKELNRKAAQGDADFSGIKFEITNKSAKSVVVGGTEYAVNKVVYTMTTNASGDATTPNNLLPYGTYEIKEVAVNGKYLLTDGTARTFRIRENGVIVSAATNGDNLVFKDNVIRGGVRFVKIDAETDKEKAQGLASLRYAEIEIYNNSSKAVKVNGTEYAPGSLVMTLKTDENCEAKTGNKDLPCGTYYAKESKRSEGYLLNSAWRVDFQIREDGKLIDTTSSSDKVTKGTNKSGWFNVSGKISDPENKNQAKLEQEIIRADLSFYKLDIDGSKVANIPFLISRLDKEGNIVESHVIVTDSEGRLNTKDRPKTGSKVNSLDEYAVDGVFIDESKLDGTTGVWFGEQSARANGRGSLIYANYLVQELSCGASAGQDTLEQFMIRERDLANIDSLFTNGKVFTLEDAFINLDVLPESDLLDVATETKVASLLENAKYIDSVRWHHLKVGQQYKLKTEIYYEDREGNIEKLGDNTVSFTPSRPSGVSTDTVNGITKNTVTVNSLGLNGGKVHAVDYIYAVNNGKDVLLVTHNRDMKEERQSLGVPFVGTLATDRDTNSHVGTPVSDAEITDKVLYENFPDRGSFIVEGTLRFADTGEEIATVRTLLNTDKRLTSVTVEEDGTINGPLSGEFTMPAFRFNAEGLDGRTVVVTEVFIDKVTKEKFIEHYDLADEGQSIHYIKVGTVAKDNETNTHTGTVIENNKVIDEVLLENLVVGNEYTVNGKFVRKDTLEVLAESENVTFTATNKTETVYITFTLDSTVLEGLSAVAFEYVSHNGVEVGKHEDPEDPDQTINYPKVRTTAVDGTTKTHTGISGKTTIVDEVKLENLTVGEKYKVYGSVHNEDGSEYIVDGNALTTSSDVFIATEKNMTISLAFSLDSTELKGSKKVIFEKLFNISEDESEENEVAKHEDPEDEGQTVYYPTGRTFARDGKTGLKSVFAEENAEIIDDFKYENLVPGEKYTMEAELFSLTKDETVEIKRFTFIPTKKNDTLEVHFFINALERVGEDLVVLETVFSGEHPVITHRDPEDKDQTVYVAKIGTIAKDKTDGDKYIEAKPGQIIEDEISYEGLEPNKPHFAIIQIFDKEKGELVPNLKIRKDFISSETGKGTVIIEAEFDATGREGALFVAFEEIYKEENPDTPIGEHKDPEDKDQTVYVPRLRTVAMDKADKDKFIAAEENQVIVDTVYYEGLEPNKPHTAVLTVYDKTEGKVVEGIEVRKVFTSSENGTGEVKVEVAVNGKELSGHVLVMFEKAFRGEHPEGELPEKPIATHEDPEDKDQTIGIPEIRTMIKDSKTGTNVVRPYWVNDVVDIVFYKGLIPGVEYELYGTFVSKADGTETEVKGSIKFTPETSEGEIEVPFTFDGTKLEGSDYVAFEELKYNGKTIAEHKDLEDPDQLISVNPIGKIEIDKNIPLPKTPGSERRFSPNTGDSYNIMLWFILFIVSLSFIVIYGVKVRRGRKG